MIRQPHRRLMIDISRHQGYIDFEQVKNYLGSDVFVMARYANGYKKDDRVDQYRDLCRANGLKFGTYLFIQTHLDWRAQVEPWAQYQMDNRLELIPMFDVEYENLLWNVPRVNQWLDAAISYMVETVGNAAIYTNRSYWSKMTANNDRHTDRPLIIAGYPRNEAVPPSDLNLLASWSGEFKDGYLPYPWRDKDIHPVGWQFTSSMDVPGVSSDRTDCNYLYFPERMLRNPFGGLIMALEDVRNALNEGTGVGQDSWASTNKEMLRLSQEILNKVNEAIKYIWTVGESVGNSGAAVDLDALANRIVDVLAERLKTS